VALFLYVFVLRPAPEQTLRYAIPVHADPGYVAEVVQASRPAPFHSLSPCSLEAHLVRWMTGERVSPLTLLTRSQQVWYWVDRQEDGAVLHGEMRWQVRGGLLGKVADSMLLGAARERTLADALRRMRAAAESRCLERATLRLHLQM